MTMPRRRTCVIAALTLMPAPAFAQPLPPQDQLPAWAAKTWAAASAANHVELSAAVNPFYQRGDFDGDGKADLAILVRDRATGKVGILVLHRVGKPALLGAGRTFGNGGDDFAWLDQWSVDDGANARSGSDSPARRRPDALRVAKEGSASALIVHRNGKYIWRQQGD